MNNLYTTFSLCLWYIAASSNDVVATNVLCPGQPSKNFCDCEGDCTGNPDFCACDSAQDCCKDAVPVVLCPGQPNENYCDCTGDCSEKPEWCQCAEAQECCDKHLPELLSDFINDDSIVLCPGQPNENYCDCTGDCSEKPEWCQCAEAQECCEKHLPESLSNPMVDDLSNSFFENVIVNSGSRDGTILCPGQPSDNYCDCEGDCTGIPEFCDCGEAQACCKDAQPVVVCPSQPKENYCDCSGDCFENPEFCACADGIVCCAKGGYSFIALGAAGLLVSLSFLIWFRRCRNKNQEASLSEAASKVMSPATSSKFNDDETINSSECRD